MEKSNVVSLDAKRSQRGGTATAGRNKPEPPTEENRAARAAGYTRNMKEAYDAYVPDEVKNGEFMDADGLNERLEDAIREGVQLVYRTLAEAEHAAGALIGLPVYDDISHFEVATCVSRLSTFFKLIAVPKDEAGQLRFMDDATSYSLNVYIMEKSGHQLALNEEENYAIRQQQDEGKE